MRKIAILFLLLAGAVFASVLDTVWRAPKYGNLVRVATLADGRQFLQVLRNDTLTCISTKDGSVVWRLDVSDTFEGSHISCRAGILDFNWDGTADFWKIVPGPGRICTLKVVGLEDSFRVNMMLADEWVFPVAMRSVSGVLKINSLPSPVGYTESLCVAVSDFDGEIVFSKRFYWGVDLERITDARFSDDINGDWMGFWAEGYHFFGNGMGYDLIWFDINIVSGETHRRLLGYSGEDTPWWDPWLHESDSWNCFIEESNYSTDFSIVVFRSHTHCYYSPDEGYHSSYSESYTERSFLRGAVVLPSRPISLKGKFVPNSSFLNYFFYREDTLSSLDSLYFGSKFVKMDTTFPVSRFKFKYKFAQDGMIISSEDSIYGVIFNMLFINRGWNLFSNPFAEPLPLSEIFDSYISPAYSWNNEDKIYNLTDILAPGQTAWVFSLDSGFVEIPQIPTADSLTYVLYPGWNLIGVPREGALASKITESPAVLNAVFGFDPQTNTYFVADTLQPFCGYWVFTTDTITITVP